MFAVLAAICFLISQFEEKLVEIDMVKLGLFFVACALAYGWAPWLGPTRGPRG